MKSNDIVLRLIDDNDRPRVNAFAVHPANPLWIMKRDLDRQREHEQHMRDYWQQRLAAAAETLTAKRPGNGFGLY